MPQTNAAAQPIDEQCPPVKVVELDSRTVPIYPPPDQLWAELNELDSIVGQGESWPLISRKSGIDKSVSLHAPWSHHVLETVIGHCARTTLSGPSSETFRILLAILSSWDTNIALIAKRKGFVRCLVKEWMHSWVRKRKLISPPLDPHLELARQMEAWGGDIARRVLATQRKSVEVVPAASVTSSRAATPPPPPAYSPGVHAVSDAPSFMRVRNFLVLADAAAIALNAFRLRTDTLVADMCFDDRPRTDERFEGVLQRIATPLEELNWVRNAVFTSDPKTTGQSYVACLQDCYQRRGYAAERCEDPAHLAAQTFVNLRGPIGPPGVNFGDFRQADDGWNSWRAIYAADGQHLAEYLRIRTQIIGLAGIYERNIISREQCFTLHPTYWTTHYTTSDLVRMADEAHRIVRDSPMTGVAPPASDVFVEEAIPIAPTPPLLPRIIPDLANPTPPDTPQVSAAGKPSQDRQKDILAAISAAGMPLTRPELVERMRFKSEGKLGANLAWMVTNGILINVPHRGYWPCGVKVPE